MSASALPIAIVGIAAELPSGSGNLDHSEFCKFLLDKGESYEDIPRDRFNSEILQGKALGQVLPTKGSFLKNLDLFDHVEFGITSKDAHHMAVSTRKLVELAFLSLLDSGIDYRGRRVACYTSGVSHDIFAVSGQDEYEARGSFANLPSMVANRVSYHLDLRGPSVPVDTACSSSLVAMHLAVQAIRAGECDAAVVGGVQINLRMVDWLNYTQGGIVNVDGRCKPFDADADGFGRGEGGVAIVLKPLNAALRDGDHIYGSVLGSAINSTGSLAPVSAPVAVAQQAAMEAALRQAGRSPQDVDFLELHATGTAKGDPTEANWVGPMFKRDNEILIGSVKGNIGHTEIAAFLASLSKVLNIFETGLIPPNVNLKTPNPAIKWNEYRLRVPTEVTPLPKHGRREVVAMTSSGIGGANGSAVIEGPPPMLEDFSHDGFWMAGADRPHLYLSGGLSPRTASSIGETIQHLRLEGVKEQDLTLTYGRRARSMPWISYAVSSNGDEARFSEPALVPRNLGPLAFVFSGQGPQHIAMGRELFRTCKVFRRSILECDGVYERMTGHSLIRQYGLFDETITPSHVLGDAWPIAVTLPSLTIIQVALFDTLAHLGLKPDIVVGHSAGETAVLYASGAASKKMVVELSIARGRGMAPLEDLDCSMAAISCSPAEAEEIIAQAVSEIGTGSLEIGCYNSADALTLSGANPELSRAVEIATGKGIFARRLKTRVAVHSSMMEHCRDTYCSAVQDVFARHQLVTPSTTVYSAATGEVMEVAGDADYFWSNTRGPVRFEQAIRAMTKANPNTTFIEMGPHPVLASYLSSLAGSETIVTCPLRRLNPKKSEKDVELRAFLAVLGQMAVAHHHVDYSVLAGPEAKPLRRLPAYPFQKKSVPITYPTQDLRRFTRPRNGPLNFPELHVNSATHPSLADHIIKSTPIMPAAGYIEMALEYGARKLWNVSFFAMLGLTAARPTPVQVLLKDSHWTIKSATSNSDTSGDVRFDRLHAQGYLSTVISEAEQRPRMLDIEAVRTRCSPFDAMRFYSDIKYFADYGVGYRRVTALWLNDAEALVEVDGLTSDMKDNDPKYIFHPAILDAAIHSSIHHVMTCHRDTQVYYLPAAVRLLTVHDALLKGVPEKVVAHIVRKTWSPKFIEFDCVVATVTGVKLITIAGLGLEQHGSALLSGPTQRYDLRHTPSDITVDRTTASPELDVGAAKHRVFTYKRGEEMLVQKMFGKLQSWTNESIWFIGHEDDTGASGFTRSLRREYPGWTIKLVSFDLSWEPTQCFAAIRQLQERPDELEDESVVDAHGRVCVPRLVPTDSPSADAVFHPSQPWTVEDNAIAHIRRPTLSAGDEGWAIIEILAVSEGTGCLREFVGQDVDTKQRLMGITNGPISSVIKVFRESCVGVDGADSVSRNVPPLSALAIVALAFGHSAFTKPARLRSMLRDASLLVTHSDTAIGRALGEILTLLGIKHTPLPSSFDLSVLDACHADFILSGYEDASTSAVLAGALKENGRLFAWNDPATGVSAALRTQPWLVGDALQSAMNMPLLAKASRVPVVAPLSLVVNAPSPGERITSKRGLFDASKSYVLIGGTGSLGVDIAWWLYENGARHVIMTSRSGRQKFMDRADTKAIQMLAHLESLADLDLRLLAVDAASVPAMAGMFKTIKEPLGGCMLLSGVLIDRPFAAQDEESFDHVFDAKVGAMKALEQAIDVKTFDWLVAFTSISGFFGSAGQTNYAAANTAMDGLMRRYDNAFSLVVPLIIDSSVAMDASRIRHLTSWAFTARQLCLCIEDGIRKLASGPFWLYVPDFDWPEVASRLGVAPVFKHLIKETLDGPDATADGESIEDIVARHLDVARQDMTAERPLTAYGLDSLSAARLAIALRHHTRVTQLQLLGDMSVTDLYRHAEKNAPETAAKPGALFDWTNLNAAGHTVVKCVGQETEEANPLILMHGTSGNGAAFTPLQPQFSTPFWFLQCTPETPFASMDALVAFYVAEIKRARPHGPYRLGTYCATCNIALELVRVLEAQGDEVVQFVFIDFVPTMFCRPAFALGAAALRNRALGEEDMTRWFRIVLDSFDPNSAMDVQNRAMMEATWTGALTSNQFMVNYCAYFRRLVAVIVPDLVAAAAGADEADSAAFYAALWAGLCARMRAVRAPKTVWLARDGLVTAMDEPIERWDEMGIRPGDVFRCGGGHKSMFFEEDFARGIEFPGQQHT